MSTDNELAKALRVLSGRKSSALYSQRTTLNESANSIESLTDLNNVLAEKLSDTTDRVVAAETRIAELEGALQPLLTLTEFELKNAGNERLDLWVRNIERCRAALTSDGSKAAAVLEAAEAWVEFGAPDPEFGSDQALCKAVAAWKGQE